MKKIVMILMVLAVLAGSPAVFSQEKSENVIQIAVLLDTSNSMDGLINQAKAQLWKMVNEFALARKNGKIPQLQIALYEYGNNNISQENGYIRQVAGLTGDLDRISDELFKLTTNGGDEYCGEVIGRAVKELGWSSQKDILKIIFIAGNEPFTQGGQDFRKACKEAIAKGIIVNTIYCGSRAEGIAGNWKEGADLADGLYSNIDQNEQIAYIAAPQDDEINKLGQALNQTYVGYGDKGQAAKELQAKQDVQAQSVAPAVMAERSLAKASVQYSNAVWDLVDASAQDPALLDKLEKDQLPPEMQKMNKAEQKKFIAEKSKERKDLQAKINKLDTERRKYVLEQQKKNANKSLSQAMLEAIREQAKKKNYQFE